jgi:hypothetical protein
MYKGLIRQTKGKKCQIEVIEIDYKELDYFKLNVIANLTNQNPSLNLNSICLLEIKLS